jgi:hypothetical protein
VGGRDCTSGVEIWHCMSHLQNGDVMCDKCRLITVLCTTDTIMANILYIKLVTYTEEIIGECQEGFWRGRSTVDQIHTMKQILEKC